MLKRYLTLLVVSLLMLVTSGCITVRSMADYDEQVDVAVTQFQRKMESFLVSLERNAGNEAASYAGSTNFYDAVKVDLSALSIRVAAIPDNDITARQLDLLLKNIELLEKIHKAGISANDIPPLRTAFNTCCTAILKLELAKKRGKT